MYIEEVTDLICHSYIISNSKFKLHNNTKSLVTQQMLSDVSI